MHYRAGTPYDPNASNESRADLAEFILAIGTERNGEIDVTYVHLDVSDALAHLIHFCHRAGLDWHALVSKAERTAEGDLEDGPEVKRDTERFPAVASSH